MSQGRKRKRSIKFLTASDEPQSNGGLLQQNGGNPAPGAESAEQYIALTEITSQGAIQRDGEGSPAVEEDNQGTLEVEEVNAESHVEECDESSSGNAKIEVEVKRHIKPWGQLFRD